MTHLLDTDICIELLRNNPVTVGHAENHSPDDLAISSITRYELMVGVGRCSESKREIEALKVDRLLSYIHEIPLASEIADRCAKLRVYLMEKGESIGPMDTLIAGTALVSGLILVSGNQREFSRIPDLKLIEWV